MAAKTKKTPATPNRRPKQQRLPGMEQTSIAELDEAAEEYVKFRDARMANGRSEAEWAGKLLELMHKHGLKVYDKEDRVVTIKEIEKVKVKTAKAEENGDGEPD